MRAVVGLFAALCITSLAGSAFAQDPSPAPEYPIFSIQRVHLGAGANYEWCASQGDEPLPAFDKEWTAGLYAAYNMTPQLSLVGSGVYSLDTKFLRTSVGLRVRIFQGGQ